MILIFLSRFQCRAMLVQRLQESKCKNFRFNNFFSKYLCSYAVQYIASKIQITVVTFQFLIGRLFGILIFNSVSSVARKKRAACLHPEFNFIHTFCLLGRLLDRIQLCRANFPRIKSVEY